MNKIKVLCLSIWYPLSMSRYFEKALRNNPNVELKTTGVYTGSYIPWMGGMYLPEKYAKPPDIPLPFNDSVRQVTYDILTPSLGDWKPDIVLAIDAGINWTAKPREGLVVTIATDPHALNYDHQRRISDKLFNMQASYSEQGDIYLPYAYSKYDCYPVHIEGLEDGTWKDVDAALIGMPYEQRVQWINELKAHGVSVIFENGPVFDEARVLYNRAKIGLNWSSLNDLNCRAFEIPAFGLPMVANRVSDIHRFLKDGVDYMGFNTIQEAVSNVMYLKNNPDIATEMGKRALETIGPHTYDARVEQMLKECGYA